MTEPKLIGEILAFPVGIVLAAAAGFATFFQVLFLSTFLVFNELLGIGEE